MNNIIVKELSDSIQKYLYSNYAKEIEDARPKELYFALTNALMEIIGKTWVNTKKLKSDENIYILSFEYMPGKLLELYLHKLDIIEEAKKSISKADVELKELLDIEKEPALGFGELGVDSSLMLDALTNEKIKTVAYAMKYENGDMIQKIIDNEQVEYPNLWGNKKILWQHKKGFNYYHDIFSRKVKAEVFDLPVLNNKKDFVNTLRMFSAKYLDLKHTLKDKIDYKNRFKDISLTEFLYVNTGEDSKKYRLAQEYFYACNCIEDIFRRHFKQRNKIEDFKDKNKIIVNEIHPTLSLIEFINVLKTGYGYSIENSVDLAKEVFYHFSFQVSEDSYETYPIEMIKELNERLYFTIIELNEFLNKRQEAIIKEGNLIFRNVNLFLSRKYIFSSKIIRDYKQKNNKRKLDFSNIYIDTKKYFSNSNKNLSSFLKNEGIDISNVDSLKLLYNYGEDKEFISKIERIKFDNKKLLLQKLNLSNINPYSIFDMNLAIFHENKRQLLKALQIAWLYYALKDNVNIKLAPITFFFAGKANVDYYMAKEIIKFINHLKDMINKDTLVKDKLKIVFVEDYNLNKARNLLKASDVFNNLTLSIYDNSSFEILNACFNFSNIISSRSGIIKNIKKKNAIYTFADTVEEVYEIKNKNLYNALETYYQNPLKDVVDNLINERNKNFNYDFKIIYKQLLKYNDSFFIFKDLYELIKVGLRVSDDYLNSKKWVSNEIENFVWANEYNLENNFIDKIRH